MCWNASLQGLRTQIQTTMQISFSEVSANAKARNLHWLTTVPSVPGDWHRGKLLATDGQGREGAKVPGRRIHVTPVLRGTPAGLHTRITSGPPDVTAS